MLFSSFEFLYLFLPLCAAIYFLSPRGWRNYVLLLASLVFYGISAPKFLPLMLAVALGDWGLGLLVFKLCVKGRERQANIAVALTVILNVATLSVFKYLDPIIKAIGAQPLGIELPAGISFYIFQAMSYVFDVRRRATEAQKNPLLFATYVSLFPQLVAGPIVRYCEVDEALTRRNHSVEKAAEGLRLFAVGLGKKVLLANGAGEMWERMTALGERNPTVLGSWLGVIFFSFQIYYDFSGYSDMAIGLGRLFGFDFPENFRYPYVSKSITEFWRRWHITLSSWFKEYVYIPLGGNRRGRIRTHLNLFTVWLLTGIWHGAGLNFALWGLYFFVILSLEKAFLGKTLEKLPKALRHCYALFFIAVGWFIFASDGISDVSSYFASMLGIGAPLWNNDALYELLRNLPYLMIMAVGATPLPKAFLLRATKKSESLVKSARNILALATLILSTWYLEDAGYNPFLYFRF